MSANNTTVVGNICSEVGLSFTTAGVPVVNLTVASSDLYQDGAGEWRDGTTSYIRCTLWRQQAENALDSLATGSRVVVVGKLRTRTVEKTEGDRRTYTELDVEEIGASLRFATADLTRNGRKAAEPVPA
jgi:single-strand DNA-binding protein